jgi:hypothetical protein
MFMAMKNRENTAKHQQKLPIQFLPASSTSQQSFLQRIFRLKEPAEKLAPFNFDRYPAASF